MTNGQVAAIDVDDWMRYVAVPDRPRAVLVTRGVAGELARRAAEPNASGPNDIDPYHAPTAGGAGIGLDGGVTVSVTNEVFWPVIQQHRLRSEWLEEDDITGTGGLHAPAVTTTPVLLINSAPVTTAGQPYPILTAVLSRG